MHIDLPEDLHHRLQHLVQDRGIPTMADVRRRTGVSTQQAWNLWHGRANVGLHLARRFEARLDFPSTVCLELERERPPAARPPGRPRTWTSSATPPAEEPTP
jgi:hypothetical protein